MIERPLDQALQIVLLDKRLVHLGQNEFEQVQGRAGVAVCGARQGLDAIFGHVLAQAPDDLVRQGPLEDEKDLLTLEERSTMTRMRESSGAITAKDGFSVVAPIRAIDPFSTCGEERILLGLVEAVDLIDEHDGGGIGRLGSAGHAPQVLHAAGDGAQRHVVIREKPLDDVGHGGLAAARGPQSMADERLPFPNSSI